MLAVHRRVAAIELRGYRRHLGYSSPTINHVRQIDTLEKENMWRRGIFLNLTLNMPMLHGNF